MLDRDTTIRNHHSPDDDRLSVTMVESWATIALFYPPETGFSGDDQPVEVRVTPSPTGEFEPWQLAPRLPLYFRYARAALIWDHDDVVKGLRALREVGATRRGLGDDFYKRISDSYRELQDAGERYPVKALAGLNNVVISTASRWITEARRRGFLPAAAPRKVTI